MKRRTLLLLTVLSMLLLLAGCKVSGRPLPEGMEEDTVVEQGREVVALLNQEDWQGVYDLLRADAQEGASLADFEAAMMKNLEKAGAYVKESEAMTTGQKLKATGEEYGTAVFYCKHEKKNVLYRIAYSVEMELMGVEVKVQ